MQEIISVESKRKRIIRTVAAVFLASILLLTFLSKTIDNFLLPMVETQRPASGILQNSMAGQGEFSGESKSYDVIVPNSSVITEGDGNSYIYILKERSKAFGEEKYVEKLKVKVLASDDSNSAIKAVVSRNDEIVTYSTRVLEDNVRVKTDFDEE